MTSHMDSLESFRDMVRKIRQVADGLSADQLPTEDQLDELQSALDRAKALLQQYTRAGGEGGV